MAVKRSVAHLPGCAAPPPTTCVWVPIGTLGSGRWPAAATIRCIITRPTSHMHVITGGAAGLRGDLHGLLWGRGAARPTPPLGLLAATRGAVGAAPPGVIAKLPPAVVVISVTS